MSGMLIGERVVEIVGTATFEDKVNDLRGELQFDANNGFLKKAQADDIKGQIFATKVGLPPSLDLLITSCSRVSLSW